MEMNLYEQVRRLLCRLLQIVTVVTVVVILMLAILPQGRTMVRTMLFIPQVLPAIPIKPQEWVTRDPVWKEVRFSTASGDVVADLILPADAVNRSAVLFFVGVVVNQPRDDPRLVALAEGLARSGMVVMMPWLNTQAEQQIVPQDIDSLVTAFQYLSSLSEVDPKRVGVGGYCTGASMVAVAAQDERIRNQVKFVNFFAGYYDAFDFVKAIGSKSRFYDDYVTPWNTDKLTYMVFRNHLIDGVHDAGDRDLLTRIFTNKEKISDGEVALLSPDGTVVYRLLNGVAFAEIDGLMEQLSPKTVDFLRQISPSTNVDQLEARVFIMHDRADRLVPSEESRRFAEAIGDDSDTFYTEFSFFQKSIQLHVDSGSNIGPFEFAREVFKLFMHMYNIMRYIS